MAKAIFINLPINNLKASMAFYTALGFKNNPHFTDDNAACMVWSDTINVMLHTHNSWSRFTDRPIPSSSSSEVMLALSVDSKDAVDALTTLVTAHCGTADINPNHDLGFMYSRSFTDLDGHVWESFWMEPKANLT